MALSNAKLKKLKKTFRLHVNWFIATLLGDDVLTKAERDELTKWGKLKVESLNFADKSYLLGRLKSFLKKSEYSDLTWEELLERKPGLSDLEKLAVKQAKMRSAASVEAVANKIIDEINEELQAAGEAVLTEATLADKVSDKVAIGVLEKKHYKKVASSIAAKTKKSLLPYWEKVSRTEMHAAKVRGSVQAIANKVDIYSKSDGVESSVSVVPSTGTCPDCASHYLDKSGNPKVFKLKELLGAGDNRDSDHSVKNGKHVNWKSVLPPMHPECRCEVRFIPPGYSWVNGKLKLTDKDALNKAIGDSALSATIKPKGPDNPDGSKGGSPPSVPGIKSPSQSTQPKTTVDDPSGGADVKVRCPFGGGDACAEHSDNLTQTGAKTHDPNSAIMEAHRKAMSEGATPTDPEAAKQMMSRKAEQAKQWGKQDHPHAEAISHLESSEIETQTELDRAPGALGMAEKHKVTLKGNGPALMKPPQEYQDPEGLKTGKVWTEGCATLPHGSGAKSEAACYDVHMGLGLTEHVPPTSTREHQGREMSMQAWMDGFHSLDTYVKKQRSAQEAERLSSAATQKKDILVPASMPEGEPKSTLIEVLDNAPPGVTAKLEKKLYGGITAALIGNHQDLHTDNIMFNPDTHDIKFIDGTGFGGNGMHDVKVQPLMELHKHRRDVKVPREMMQRMAKTSLGDMKRMCGRLEPWQQGQTFLRMKYIEHLQKAEGHLDFDKFRTTMTVTDEGSTKVIPRIGGQFWTGSNWSEQIEEVEGREAAGTLPNQLFESFAKAWMMTHAADESSPHHADAKELQGMGVFMPPGADIMENPKKAREQGLHEDYEKSIKPAWPEHLLSSKKAKPMEDYKEPERIESSADVSVAAPAPDPEAKKPLEVDPEDLGEAANNGAGTFVPKHKRKKMEKSIALYVRLDH